MKLHHAPDTRSVRIVWLLEELGLPYDLELYTLGGEKMRSANYRELHPMNRVPALEDGDVRLFESGAIVEYILARHGNGRLRPTADSPNFPLYLQWLHYAEGMMMPQVNVIVVESIFLPEEKRNPTNLARARKLLTNSLNAVEQGLEGKEWLAGEFSGADIMTGHASSVAVRLGCDVSDKPNVAAYVERINARPALQKARAVGT